MGSTLTKHTCLEVSIDEFDEDECVYKHKRCKIRHHSTEPHKLCWEPIAKSVMRHFKMSSINDVDLGLWTERLSTRVRWLPEEGPVFDAGNECVMVDLKRPLHVEYCGKTMTLSVFGEERVIDVINQHVTHESIVADSLIVLQSLGFQVDVLTRGFILQNAPNAGDGICAEVVRYFGPAHKQLNPSELRATLVQNTIRPGGTLTVSIDRDRDFVEYASIPPSVHLTVHVLDGLYESLVPLRIKAHDTLWNVAKTIQMSPQIRTQRPRALYFKGMRLDLRLDYQRPIIDWGVVDGSVLRLAQGCQKTTTCF